MTTKNILLSLAFVSTFAACAQNTDKRNISNFTKINATGVASIVYENSNTTSLIIEGDANEIKNIETVVKGNVLYVKANGNYKHSFKIKITSPQLEALNMSGASNFKAPALVKAETFSIVAKGASSVEMPLSAKKVISEMEGASNIKLSGNTTELVADLSGASSLKAGDLISQNTLVTASGASSAKVYASQKLVTNSTGASDIKYNGNPTEILRKETSVNN